MTTEKPGSQLVPWVCLDFTCLLFILQRRERSESVLVLFVFFGKKGKDVLSLLSILTIGTL